VNDRGTQHFKQAIEDPNTHVLIAEGARDEHVDILSNQFLLVVTRDVTRDLNVPAAKVQGIKQRKGSKGAYETELLPIHSV
jgi:hypothetical protein